MEVVQWYVIRKRTNAGWSENKTVYVLRPPRSYKEFSSYEEAKAAFNKMRKAKLWMLSVMMDGCGLGKEVIVYTNKTDANKYCIICNKT